MTIPMKAEITAEVGGQANVDRLRSIARDFRSECCAYATACKGLLTTIF